MPDRPEHVDDHYKKVKLDTWDALDAWFTPVMRYGFYAGNVIKYLQRAHTKGKMEDVKKALHYSTKVRELLEQHPELLEATNGETHLADPGHAQPGVAGVPQVSGT